MSDLSHPYDPNVTNCSTHDMGDCPYHKDGPCQNRSDGEARQVCGRSRAEHEPTKPIERRPVGRYRATMTLIGDDPGPEVLAWLLLRSMEAYRITARVEEINPID